jgi:hypothetical protein
MLTKNEGARVVSMWLPAMNVKRGSWAKTYLYPTAPCALDEVRFGYEVERMHGLSLQLYIGDRALFPDPAPFAILAALFDVGWSNRGLMRPGELLTVQVLNDTSANVEARPYVVVRTAQDACGLPFENAR